MPWCLDAFSGARCPAPSALCPPTTPRGPPDPRGAHAGRHARGSPSVRGRQTASPRISPWAFSFFTSSVYSPMTCPVIESPVLASGL